MTHESLRAKVRARRCALQALYQWQLAGQEPGDILDEFVSDRELLNVDRDYFRRLTLGVTTAVDSLEARLVEVLDRSLDKLTPVERAVLWIGVYELEHCKEVPWRVVINEAVELSKMFGAEQAHRYINANLDVLARRLRSEEAGG